MNVQSLLFLYFDAQERSLKNKIINISNLIRVGSPDLSYSQICTLLQTTAQLEILKKIELDINALLFYDK